MACERVQLEGGGVAIVCGRFPRVRPRKCRGCGQKTADLLCDGPKPGGRTCDAPVCAKCAKTIGPDRHLCPACQVPPPQLSLF